MAQAAIRRWGVGLGAAGAMLAVAGVALPLYLGYRAEQSYLGFERHFARWPSMDYRTNAYDRGWFRSTATGSLTLNDGRRLEVTHRISHGPVVRATQDGPRLAAALVESRLRGHVAAEPSTTRPSLDVDTLIPLRGDPRAALHVPAFELVAEGGGEVTMPAAAAGAAVIRAGDAAVGGELAAPLLVVRHGEAETSFRDAKLRWQLVQEADGQAYGTVWLEAGRMTLGAMEPQIHIDALRLSSESSLDSSPGGEGVRLSYSVGLEAVRGAGQVLGPGVVEMDLRHLDPHGLRLLARAGRSSPAPGAGTLPGRLRSAFAQVVRDGTELELSRAELSTGAGQISGYASLRLGEGRGRTLGSWLRALRLEARLSVPEQALRDLLAGAADETAGARFEALLERGMVVREGDRIASFVTLRDGVLTVNGARAGLLR